MTSCNPIILLQQEIVVFLIKTTFFHLMYRKIIFFSNYFVNLKILSCFFLSDFKIRSFTTSIDVCCPPFTMSSSDHFFNSTLASSVHIASNMSFVMIHKFYKTIQIDTIFVFDHKRTYVLFWIILHLPLKLQMHAPHTHSG